MVDISEIFAEKEPVFLDGCAFNKSSGWYRKAVFPHKHFADLDLFEIQTAAGEFELFANYIDNSSTEVYFSPKVLEEMTNFSLIIEKNFNYLELKRDGSLDADTFEGRRALMSARVWYNNILSVAKSKVYSDILSNDFKQVNDLLVRLSDTNNLKVKKYSEAKSVSKKPKVDQKADEELVACALYHSLTKDKVVRLVTGDRDVIKLLAAFTLVCFQKGGKLQPIVDNLYNFPVKSWNLVRPNNNYVDTREMIDCFKTGKYQHYFE